MPKFNIEHPTSHSAPDTYSKLKEFLSKGGEIQKFDSKVQCEFDDQKKSCLLKGSKFKAEVSIVGESNGSKIQILVDLPFLLTPLKGKIQEILIKMLSKHL